MKVTCEGLVIHLEQDEINVFLNIIMFAKDYHIQQTKEGNCCMTKAELKLTEALIEITDKLQSK